MVRVFRRKMGKKSKQTGKQKSKLETPKQRKASRIEVSLCDLGSIFPKCFVILKRCDASSRQIGRKNEILKSVKKPGNKNSQLKGASAKKILRVRRKRKASY